VLNGGPSLWWPAVGFRGDRKFGPLILTAPQVLRVDAFEDSGIAIKILGDAEPIRQWEVMGELRKRLKKAFDEEGIEIPLPHRVLVTRAAKATDVGEGQNPR
jgi:small conductance mechanosensitive channel